MSEKITFPIMNEANIHKAVKQYIRLYAEGTTEAIIDEYTHRAKLYYVYAGLRSYTTPKDGIEFYLITRNTKKRENNEKWYALYNISLRGLISFSDIQRYHHNPITTHALNKYCAELLHLPLVFEYSNKVIRIKHMESGNTLILSSGIVLSTAIHPMGLYSLTTTSWQARVHSEAVATPTIREEPVRTRAEEGTFDPDSDIEETEITAAEG